MRIRSTFIFLTAAAALFPRPARADVSSWLAVGGGAGVERNHDTGQRTTAGTVTYSLGVGSTPRADFVIGGLLRGTTFVDLGTDLALAARACTGSFARGEWGVALDAGVLWRPWLSDTYGQWPLEAVLTGGSPWGLQLALGAELASVSGGTPAQGFFATLEIDLLRLTVMRQGPSEKWWYNPAPAGGHLSQPSP